MPRAALRPLLICLLLGLPGSAAADWASDEAYLKQLAGQLKRLKSAADLFAQHRRALELAEAEFSALQLPLADSTASPERIVRQVLASSFPQVRAKMAKLATRSPLGVEIWKWRCTVEGAVDEIRWATQLLLQKGLFVLPSAAEPVRMTFEPGQRRGALVFIGHHIRLRDVPSPKLPQVPGGSDALATRTDPLADDIRRLRREVMVLRKRVLDIIVFEARIEAMRLVVKHLKSLTKDGRDPFRVFTPLLDLELVQYRTLMHDGQEVAVTASAPSESARAAARRWLEKQGRPQLRYRFQELGLLYGAAAARVLPLADDGPIGGHACALRLAGARAIDLGAAGGAPAIVTVGATPGTISADVPRGPLRRALAAAARAATLELLWAARDVLVVPQSLAAAAQRALADRGRVASASVALLQPRTTVARALALLRASSLGPVETPAAVMNDSRPAALVGRAPVGTWLRLLGAALGLGTSLVGSSWQLAPLGPGATPVSLLPVADTDKPSPAPAESAPLGLLRPRVLVACGGRSSAVVAAPGEAPRLVRVGARLGRGRGRVVRVDRDGVKVRWQDAGVKGVVLLPFGELLAGPSAAGSATKGAASATPRAGAPAKRELAPRPAGKR
jgi:hypothetical protein